MYYWTVTRGLPGVCEWFGVPDTLIDRVNAVFLSIKHMDIAYCVFQTMGDREAKKSHLSCYNTGKLLLNLGQEILCMLTRLRH